MRADLRHRLRSLFRRRRVERELDEELRFHVDHQVDAYVRQGLSPGDATRRAAIEFGRLTQIHDEHRDARGIAFLDDLGRDIRYGVRQLRRSPGFAAAALLCLALGIGATTTVYSVVDAILVEPLPFRDAERLVRLTENIAPSVPGGPVLGEGITYQEFIDWRTRAKTFSDMAAFTGVGQRLVRTSAGSAGLWGSAVSPNLFSMLGVRPVLGRTFIAGDEIQRDLVVLSHDTWRRHFSADPSIVGQRLEFRAGALLGIPMRAMTVIGVLPDDAEILSRNSDFFVPMATPTGGRPGPRVTTIAIVAPGVSFEAASEEANAIGTGLRPESPATRPSTGPRFQVESFTERSVKDVRPAFRLLLAAVAVVLLIVCANVANLLLARGTTRQRELAVRVAIGASRARMTRQILTECMVLAASGAALGALIAAAGIALVRQLAMVDAPGIFRLMFGSTILPRANEVDVDVTVLAVALTVAAVTSVVFGLLPAIHLSRTGDRAAMQSRGGAPGTARMRAALAIVQVTLATVLLVGAGLLTRSFVRLMNVNTGYDPSHVLAVNLLFPDQYPIARKADTIDALLTRFRRLPDVRAAGFSRHGLLIGETLFIGAFASAERAAATGTDRIRVRSVSDGFLTAMGVPVLEGREFGGGDDLTSPIAVVMNRSAARLLFGVTRAVGQPLDWRYGPMQSRPATVIGVVEDLRQTSPFDDVFPEIFVHYRQLLPALEQWKATPAKQNELAIGFLSFALRTGADPSFAMSDVRQVVNAIDPNIGIDVIVPLAGLVSNTVARERFYAVLLGVFAAVAGLLALVGIYSVLAYAVAQRTQEIGIRLSLGAPRVQVLALVLRKGLLLTAIGIALGSLGAAAASGLLRNMLFGITALDAKTFAVVPAAFAAVAMIACYVPARRATRIDPIVALRQE